MHSLSYKTELALFSLWDADLAKTNDAVGRSPSLSPSQDIQVLASLLRWSLSGPRAPLSG